MDCLECASGSLLRLLPWGTDQQKVNAVKVTYFTDCRKESLQITSDDVSCAVATCSRLC